jgi:hypothetical protein
MLPDPALNALRGRAEFKSLAKEFAEPPPGDR